MGHILKKRKRLIDIYLIIFLRFTLYFIPSFPKSNIGRLKNLVSEFVFVFGFKYD